MAVGAISSVTSTIPVRQVEYKPQTNAARERELKVDAAREIPGQSPAVSEGKEDKRAEERQEELENLAAVSEDGDTVQVSPEGNDRLELDKFGKVVTPKEMSKEEAAAKAEKKAQEKKIEEKKEEEKKLEAKEALKETLQKAEKKAEQLKNFDIHKSDDKKADQRAQQFDDEQELITQPVSTVGRTETQIKQMYAQGDISKNEYDRAIEIREDRKEDIRENGRQFSEDSAEVNTKKEQVNQDAIEMEELFAPDASQTIEAATRAEILSTLQDFAIKDS